MSTWMPSTQCEFPQFTCLWVELYLLPTCLWTSLLQYELVYYREGWFDKSECPRSVWWRQEKLWGE